MTDVVDIFRRGSVKIVDGAAGAPASMTAAQRLAEYRKDIAASLREMADDVETGKLKTDAVMVVSSNNGSVTAPDTFGRPLYYSEVVGLLYAAAHCTLTGVLLVQENDE